MELMQYMLTWKDMPVILCQQGNMTWQSDISSSPTELKRKTPMLSTVLPTEEMIADYFTKPLQGAFFCKFHNLVLGIIEKDYDQYKLMYQEILVEYGLIDQMKPE